ncbi:MAG: hypothetical protein J1E97_06630 [Muribaculaceae bacterium]|nr:hypothetical protein [Muribaculaceae bacterium]
MILRKIKDTIKWGAGGIFCVCMLLGGCAQEDEPGNPDGTASGLRVKLTLDPYTGYGETRATTDADRSQNVQDQWSYRGFTSGDEVGFYASTTNGYLQNEALVYTQVEGSGGEKSSSFGMADGSTFNPTTIKDGNVFFYFPYTDQMPTLKADGLGLELRTKTEPFSNASYPDGPYRCIDFIVSEEVDLSNLGNGLIYGSLVHSFSELIIMRGSGFDNPKVPAGSTDDPYKIVVKLNAGYTHVIVENPTNPWKCNVKLTSQAGYVPTGSTETSLDATLWEAWKGGNYGATQTNPEGYPAWYVLLPTQGSNTSTNRSKVEYIQLYDNDGNLQTIKDLYLSGATGYVHHQKGNYLDRTWRYPMQISMTELVPTVFPFSIEEWGNGDITNARTRGITQYNLEDFISAYNSYVASGRPTSKDEILLQYGDKINTKDGSYWHFYILDNLDLSYYTDEPVIPKLQDVIDGKSSPGTTPATLSGLTRPLVDSMAERYDSLLNLTVESPYLIDETPAATASPAGVLANTMTGGGIENCTVNQGYLSVQAPAGMFVGRMNGGSISNSRASGVVIGTQSNAAFGYLVGSSSTTDAFNNNNSTVVFSIVNRE